jgi:regulator of protease activity HflC (stomatin/prohibitin superfamily)
VLVWNDNGQAVTGDFPKMQAYSFDQQPADFRVSINYRIPDSEVENVYRTYLTVENVAERVIARRLPTIIKTVFGSFTAVSVIQERTRFNQALSEAVLAELTGPVTIDSIQVEDIAFSDAFEQAIEARMQAQIEVEKRNQELKTREIDAKMTVVQAQAEADSRLAKAKAEAEAITLTGNATAEAIKARAGALADNPLLVQLTLAERWDGVQPRMLFGGGNGAAPPVMLQLPAGE